VNLHGLPVRLVDTAGLRDLKGQTAPGGGVEAAGMELARAMFAGADLILLLLDEIPELLSGENAGILEKHGHKTLIVLNKSDLRPGAPSPAELFGRPALELSAKTGEGLKELGEALYREITARSGSLNFAEAAPPTLRQRRLLAEAREELAALSEEYARGLPADLLSVRLDAAAALLGEVMGLAGTEELLDAVFSNFCLGK
jgi:tRNA modification GTPase